VARAIAGNVATTRGSVTPTRIDFPPRPVLRERAGVRVMANVERLSTDESPSS